MLIVWVVVLTVCMLSGDAEVVEDIKMFDVVDLAKAGVTEVKGVHNNSKAYKFTDKTGSLIVKNANVSTLFAKQAFLIKEFAVKAYLKTTSGGTIVFLSRGKEKGSAFNIVFRWRGTNDIEVATEMQFGGTSRILSCSFDDGLRGVSTNDWLHLTVRVHVEEQLIRCQIRTESGKVLYRYKGREGDVDSANPFPLDGKLRLAQQLLTGSENLADIRAKFLGSLQDVVISFGDPNCTITIEDTGTSIVPSTTPPTSQACTTKQTPVKDNTCIDGNDKKRNNGDEWKEGYSECNCKSGKTYCVRSVKRCLYRGKEYLEGATWDDEKNCDKCICKDGEANCAPTDRVFLKDGCPWQCGDDESGVCPRVKSSGCFCDRTKIGKVLYNGKCIDPIGCPCVHKGKEYSAGVFRDKCQFCYCSSGKFSCIPFC